jgi:hypothetical protein
MNQKEMTNILYNTIEVANSIEIQNIENKEYNIFKAAESEDYMVCIFDDENSYNSDVFHTINECHDWIKQNS